MGLFDPLIIVMLHLCSWRTVVVREMAGPGMIAPILMHQLGLSVCRRVATQGSSLGKREEVRGPCFGGDQTSSQRYGEFEGFPTKSALFGLVIYSGPWRCVETPRPTFFFHLCDMDSPLVVNLSMQPCCVAAVGKVHLNLSDQYYQLPNPNQSQPCAEKTPGVERWDAFGSNDFDAKNLAVKSIVTCHASTCFWRKKRWRFHDIFAGWKLGFFLVGKATIFFPKMGDWQSWRLFQCWKHW